MSLVRHALQGARLLTLFATLLCIGAAAPAQSYPDKPVKIVVPVAGGGGVDVRALGFDLIASTPELFGKQLQEDVERWGPVAKAANEDKK
jgi:tripartite-type tricarboxylate transporter receptor subunit TctC